jgi:two-component system, NarL family, nitrate/nitrite response regulator NarL
VINILLVDEHASIRRGVRMRLALESDFTVVGEASDGWEALQLVRELQPHIVVTGIRIPGLDGIALTERLHQDFPNCAVVILSLYDDAATRERASKAGAAFFISKKNPNGELIKAIRAAAGKP